jgi:hypothetical protein
MAGEDFRILATRCGSCGCGCPTIMESADGHSIVIVGDVGDPALSSDSVQAKIGEGETAIMIPKSLLLEALKALA